MESHKFFFWCEIHEIKNKLNKGLHSSQGVPMKDFEHFIWGSGQERVDFVILAPHSAKKSTTEFTFVFTWQREKDQSLFMKLLIEWISICMSIHAYLLIWPINKQLHHVHTIWLLRDASKAKSSERRGLPKPQWWANLKSHLPTPSLINPPTSITCGSQWPLPSTFNFTSFNKGGGEVQVNLLLETRSFEIKLEWRQYP